MSKNYAIDMDDMDKIDVDKSQYYYEYDKNDYVYFKNDDIDEKVHFDKSQYDDKYIVVKDYVDFKNEDTLVAVSPDGSIVATFNSGKFILCLCTR